MIRDIRQPAKHEILILFLQSFTPRLLEFLAPLGEYKLQNFYLRTL